MSYGVEILNDNDRIVIDTNYVNIVPLLDPPTVVAGAAAYPGYANSSNSDLVVAQPSTTVNTTLAVRTGAGGSATWSAASRYNVLRRFDSFSDDILPSYGLLVRNESANIIFSSNIGRNFEIVTIGVFNSSKANTLNIVLPSSTTLYSDFNKYYCCMAGTLLFSFNLFTPPTGYDYVQAYTFLYANSTHGQIRIDSYTATRNLDPPYGTTYGTRFSDFQYMILKELS
jgi:hypothetical protein